MKKKIIIIALVVIVVLGGGIFFFMRNMSNPSVGINNTITNEDSKEGTLSLDNVLVVYFSYGGNTQKLAKEVSDQVGGDFRRIETVEEYPEESQIYDLSKQEQDDDIKPAIKDLDIDITKYDTVFIGYPIWWYTYPQVIKTFFDTYDMSNKTIVPFVTHGGSAMSGTEEDMREYLKDKNVTVLEGLPVSRNDIENDQSETVSSWLKSLNLK